MNYVSVAKVQTISCISSHFLAFLLFCALQIEGTKRSVYLRESPKMGEEPRIEIVR